jgi:hypothetical protein
MSFASDSSAFGLYGDKWRSEERPRLVEQLCNVSHLLRGLSVKMRFGELSRAPLHLLRLNLLGEIVRCDWLARSPDPWDAYLSQSIRERHSSLQTLKDAIDVRALLFETLPHVETADFRVYRSSADDVREMIITGCAQRNDNSSRRVHSLVMRAKVLGFRFHLEGDVLRKIPYDEQICANG